MLAICVTPLTLTNISQMGNERLSVPAHRNIDNDISDTEFSEVKIVLQQRSGARVEWKYLSDIRIR